MLGLARACFVHRRAVARIRQGFTSRRVLGAAKPRYHAFPGAPRARHVSGRGDKPIKKAKTLAPTYSEESLHRVSAGSGGRPDPPSSRQLRIHFMHSSVLMVGFGFMDNFVMIQAGDFLDNTIGVKFGLATLTSAAFGQICSDVSGVAFGGVIEAVATKLGLPVAALSPAQQRLPHVRLVGTAGMIAGVICGCLLGMTCLFWMDLEAAERAKRQRELDTMFDVCIAHGHKIMGAERASLFLLDRDAKRLWSKVATGVGEDGTIISIPSDSGIVGFCAQNAKPIIVNDPYSHPMFNKSVDKSLGFRTRNILCWPVVVEKKTDGPSGSVKRLVGVVEVINKIDGDFTDNDEKLTRMLADHVAVFLEKSDNV